MKLKHLVSLLLTALTLTLTGCTAPALEPDIVREDESGALEVGTALTIRNTDDRLELLDNKTALAADGLYYATWVSGNSTPYENSDGETVDLYDAQLYLLLSEGKSVDAASESIDSWLNAARTNYDVSEEESIDIDNTTYTLLTYTCQGDENPFSHGISAFALSENNAVCIELTCTEDFPDDLRSILTDFLNCCSFSTDL